MSVTINSDGSIAVAAASDSVRVRLPDGRPPVPGSFRAIGATVFDELVGQVGDAYQVGVAVVRVPRVEITVAVDTRLVWPWQRRRITRLALAAARPVTPVGFAPDVRVLERWRCRSMR